MIREHDRVVLACNLADQKLESGNVGTVVHVHRGRSAFEVEFVTLSGDTIAVVTVDNGQIRSVESGESRMRDAWRSVTR